MRRRAIYEDHLQARTDAPIARTQRSIKSTQPVHATAAAGGIAFTPFCVSCHQRAARATRPLRPSSTTSAPSAVRSGACSRSRCSFTVVLAPRFLTHQRGAAIERGVHQSVSMRRPYSCCHRTPRPFPRRGFADKSVAPRSLAHRRFSNHRGRVEAPAEKRHFLIWFPWAKILQRRGHHRP